jgi:O-antigen/teichoic acid export membrane protein
MGAHRLSDTTGNLRAQLIKGTLGMGLLTGFSLPLSLATSIILARGLGPDGFGKYAFVTACVTLLSLPVGPGLFQLVTREVAAYQQERKWGLLNGFTRWVRRRGLLISMLLVGGITFGALFFSHGTMAGRWSLLLIGGLAIPFLCLQNVNAGILRGTARVIHAKIPDLVVRPLGHLVICAVLLACGVLSPLTALTSQVFVAILVFFTGVILVRRTNHGDAVDGALEYRTREWRRAWQTFVLLVTASIFNTQVGIVLLGWLGADQDVAALRVASKGAQFVIISLTIVNMVIAPHITSAYRSGNHQRMQKLARQSARVAFLSAFPVAICLIFWGAPIIGLLFGNEYVGSATRPLAILAVGQLINSAFGSVGLFLSMSGHERDTFHGQAWALLINVTLAVYLIPRFGATGAACAAMAGLLTWNAVLAYKVVKRLKLRPGAF